MCFRCGISVVTSRSKQETKGLDFIESKVPDFNLKFNNYNNYNNINNNINNTQRMSSKFLYRFSIVTKIPSGDTWLHKIQRSIIPKVFILYE